jgi:hypothetical protein
MTPKFISTTLLVAVAASCAHAFSSVLFQESPTMQLKAPSKMKGIEFELPDFEELFNRIQQVSPLARSVITGYSVNNERGFKGVVDHCKCFFLGTRFALFFRGSTSSALNWILSHFFRFNSLFSKSLALNWIYSHDFDSNNAPANLKWKTVESNKRRIVHKIDKIDNFQGHKAPIVRFRSTLHGPCVDECFDKAPFFVGESFANFIMNLEQRKKWDAQIEQVYEIYPINDLDWANIAMGFGQYGDCSKLGVGYSQTKAAMGITPREQLTLCGIQDFPDGSCIIWGTEMEEWHDHLMPEGPRHTRSKSHLISATITPTSDGSFDVEYVLQLDIGGNIPTFLTAPIVIDLVKTMFKTVKAFFAQGKGGSLDMLLKEKAARDLMGGRNSILMTP